MILGLLEDAIFRGKLLVVPHTGLQADRFKVAMEERNEWIVLNGQPAVSQCAEVSKDKEWVKW